MSLKPVAYLPGRQGQRVSPCHGREHPAPPAHIAERVQQDEDEEVDITVEHLRTDSGRVLERVAFVVLRSVPVFQDEVRQQHTVVLMLCFFAGYHTNGALGELLVIAAQATARALQSNLSKGESVYETVTVDWPTLVPSAVLVAVMTAVPADTPVTTPVLLTVATLGVALDQVTVCVAPAGDTVGVALTAVWQVAVNLQRREVEGVLIAQTVRDRERDRDRCARELVFPELPCAVRPGQRDAAGDRRFGGNVRAWAELAVAQAALSLQAVIEVDR
nr:hypothetical protein [Tanacetum cinerariifolium]